MKAFCASKYGSMDYFGIREIARPAPRENQVLIKVHAVSINDWDWADLGRITRGHWLARLSFGWSKPKRIIGSDIAGRVEGVGRNVTRFKPGDAVFGDLSRYFGGFGGFAEYVCAHENQLVPKPEHMTFEQAAAIPQAGALIVQALAAGGCGTMGIQLAKLSDVEAVRLDCGYEDESPGIRDRPCAGSRRNLRHGGRNRASLWFHSFETLDSLARQEEHVCRFAETKQRACQAVRTLRSRQVQAASRSALQIYRRGHACSNPSFRRGRTPWKNCRNGCVVMMSLSNSALDVRRSERSTTCRREPQ
jgi:hypothetical protein